MYIKKMITACAASVLLAASNFASAGITQVSVDAMLNSTSGGVARDSGIYLSAGQAFSVTVASYYSWNFNGDESYWTDAGGWYYIDENLTNPDGSTFTGHVAALIGQIGTGTPGAGSYFTVGTNFAGIANATGELNFFFLDDATRLENDGLIIAEVATRSVRANVPEPSSLSLLGLGLLALARRRRT